MRESSLSSNPVERNEGEFVAARENSAPEGRPDLIIGQRFIAGEKLLIPRLKADARQVMAECEQPRRRVSSERPSARPILGL